MTKIHMKSSLYSKVYMNDDTITLNVPKCEFIFIGTYQSLVKMSDIRFHINIEPLRQVTVIILVCIDSNIIWNDHISTMIPKLFLNIYISICLFGDCGLEIVPGPRD